MIRDSLLHLPIFLLIFAMVLTVLVCLSLLAGWTGLYNPAFRLDPGWPGKQLPATAAKVLPVSVIASLFLLFFRIRRKPGNRLLSFVLPLAASFIMFTAGVSLIQGPAGSPFPRDYGVLNPFTPKTIHETEEGLIYVDAVTGTRDAGASVRLDGLIRFADGKLDYDRSAALDAKGSVIISNATFKKPLSVTPANPVYQPVFKSPVLIASLSADAAALNSYLGEKRSDSAGGFALAVFSILLLATGCMYFIRMTRWPLFNTLVTFALFRGIFLILRFLESDIGREVRGMISGSSISASLPSLTFLALGAVLTAITLIFPGRRYG